MPLSFSQFPQPLNFFVFFFSLYITPNHPIAIIHLSFLNSEQYPLKLNMSKLEIIKKIKRLSPPEPSPSIFAIYLASVCIILCFFYFDYRALTPVFRSSTWFGYSGSLGGHRRPGFFEVGTDGCDLFDGDWVWDDSYPLYRSQDCLFVDSGFRCLENGRPDDLYTKWRWQPKNCDLPRFDSKNMLEKLRNRRLVFVGDSIGRNQWESLLCMLSSAVPNKTSIYEVNGNPITKHTGFLVFKFSDYNCTIEYYRSPFLVPSGHAPAGASKIVKTTLKVDQMDWSAPRWKDADVLVLNSGHWWNYEKTTRAGCYFQEGSVVKMEMSVDSAFRRSIKTLIDWIGREVNLSKTQILFRSFAPVHFRDGEWNTGGRCHEETLPELGSSPVPHQSSHLEIIVDVLSKYSGKPQRNKLDLLNVTFMSSLRKDGHLSLYYQSPSQGPVALHRQDCSHWCLPGVPDSWNELLYAVFLQREFTRSQIYAQAPL